jgi:hypothetical protein
MVHLHGMSETPILSVWFSIIASYNFLLQHVASGVYWLSGTNSEHSHAIL